MNQWTVFAVALFAALIAFVVLRAIAGFAARARETRHHLHLSDTTAPDVAKTLVVLVHGLPGRRHFAGAEALAAEVMPHADHLVFDYDSGMTRNLDVMVVSDTIERTLHALCETHDYRRIVMLGYSAGAALLRKAFVWGHGHEEDRARLGPAGKRDWVDRVERIVLLAGMNRGWSASPRPEHMSAWTALGIRLGEGVARTLGIGRGVMALRRGAPFIANTRVQWICLAQSAEVASGALRFPQVIQLIGSVDDVVSREDASDLLAAHGCILKTLPQTGHPEIGRALMGGDAPGARERRDKVAEALLGDLDALEPDRVHLLPPDPEVTRIVYVMHGIRDYGNWTDVLKSDIERRCRAAGETVAVLNMKYGYFPMLPFILYSDRQKNVRRFMDQYTEHLARYPNAIEKDFAGHSNGTYILASAMQHYVTVRVRRVFFAGSVVPKHYPWSQLIADGRVRRVVNVVATGDWVVALFPKLFEQIADLVGIRPTTGWLDLGAAGFRGFLDSGEQSSVQDLKFASGAHSTGVQLDDRGKLEAISAYLASGDDLALSAFRQAPAQSSMLGFLSNITPLVWAVLVAIVVSGGLLLSGLGWIALAVYAVVIVSVLYMV